MAQANRNFQFGDGAINLKTLERQKFDVFLWVLEIKQMRESLRKHFFIAIAFHSWYNEKDLRVYEANSDANYDFPESVIRR